MPKRFTDFNPQFVELFGNLGSWGCFLRAGRVSYFFPVSSFPLFLSRRKGYHYCVWLGRILFVLLISDGPYQPRIAYHLIGSHSRSHFFKPDLLVLWVSYIHLLSVRNCFAIISPFIFIHEMFYVSNIISYHIWIHLWKLTQKNN